MQDSEPTDDALRAFTRRLLGAETMDELIDAAHDEVTRSLGYTVVWVAVLNVERTQFTIMHRGHPPEIGLPSAHAVPSNDPFLSQLVHQEGPFVIEDARHAEGVNRAIAEQVGNRTMVNVPLQLVDSPFGTLGTGTFRDEGVRIPTDAQVAYLERMAHQLAVALARVALSDERERAKERDRRLARAFAERQRFESIGALAGGVAHDFNNLLTVVRASVANLRMGDLAPEEIYEELTTLDEASVRAADLTARLLAMGKRQSLEVKAVEIYDALNTVVNMLRRVVPSHLEIDVISGASLPKVLGDAHQLEQVLLNLALNGRDAMPHGGRLTLETEQVTINGAFRREHPWATPGRYVLLSVTDTGEGMPPEVLERVFEPFFTTKEATGGSGLGLAVSRGIVEQHGGMLHVYSEVGLGTTFKVYLPVAERAAVDVGPKLDGPVVGGDETILLADDQPHVRNAIARSLARAGYHVHKVANGLEALEAVDRAKPDLIILDAVMPQLGGRATYERLKQTAPGVPVLFVSGYGAEELSARFLADLEVQVLPKPFAPDALLRRVRKMLDDR